MSKKQRAQKITLLATAVAVELSQCYEDKDINKIKIFLYQIINSLNSIQGLTALLDDPIKPETKHS